VALAAPAAMRRAALNADLIRCLKMTGAAEKPCDVAWPPDPRAGYHAGLSALRANHPADAIRPLTECLRNDPGDRLCGFYLGTAYRRAGDEKQAVDVWRKSGAGRFFLALGYRNGSADDLKTAIEIGDRHESTFYKLGDLLWDSGRTAEAGEAYGRAIALTPGNDVEREFAASRVAEASGDHDAAFRSARAVAEMQPRSPRGYLAAAEILRRAGRGSEVIEWCSRCAKTTGALECYIAAADTSLANRDAAAAARWAEEAIERFPHDAAPYSRLGLAYAALGRFDNADRMYAKAEALDPGNFWIPIYRGDAAAQSGQPALAFRRYAQAERLNPASPAVQIAYGHLYRRLGNIPAAITAYRTALRYAPDTAEAVAGLREIQ
ncbi:MAG TPA: tetratricopeptide repeat protein, partial [Thermoanaerobaculia bacterium]